MDVSKKSEARGVGRDQEKFIKSRNILLACFEDLQTKNDHSKVINKELSILARRMEKKMELTNVN